MFHSSPTELEKFAAGKWRHPQPSSSDQWPSWRATPRSSRKSAPSWATPSPSTPSSSIVRIFTHQSKIRFLSCLCTFHGEFWLLEPTICTFFFNLQFRNCKGSRMRFPKRRLGWLQEWWSCYKLFLVGRDTKVIFFPTLFLLTII